MKEVWTYKKLGDIASYVNGFPFKPTDWVEDGKPIIRIQNLTGSQSKFNRCSRDDIPSKYFVKRGDILISWSATLGVYEWELEDALLNQHIFKVVFDKIKINKSFFRYAIIISLAEMGRHTNGATMKHIRKGDFDNIEIPIPSLAEQERIVERLDSAFAQIDELKSNAEKQLADARALFQSALTQAMQPKPGWQEKTFIDVFDDITDFVAAGSFADLRKNVVYNSEPDFAQLIRTTDLKNRFNNKSFVYVNEHAFKYLWRVNLNEECIILPNVGVNCGEVYYLHPSMLKHVNNVLGPNAILVRSRKVNNRFLAYYLQGVDFQKEIKHITSSMAQPKYNKTNLKTRIVHYPSANEQKALVAYLDSLSNRKSELEEISRKTAAECDALKQALLRQIFE